MKFFTLALLCLSLVPMQAHAASNFECLPSNTVFNWRIPNGAQLSTALMPTKLYKLLSNQDRWDALMGIIENADPDAFEEFTAGIEAFNLQISDLPKVLQGETGAAMVMHPPAAGDDKPGFTVFIYFEAEADLAERLVGALNQAVELAKGKGESLERSDYKLGDHEVIELLIDHGEATLLINKSGTKFVFAMTGKGSEAVTKQALATFLDARAAAGDANGFAKIVTSTPGLSDQRPSGASMFEFTMNPQALISLIPEDEMATPNLAGAEVKKALGLHNFKSMLFEINVENNLMHQYGFMGLEKPLAGVARLLDLPELSSAPGAWVPSNIVGYGHYGLDLQAIYHVVTETVVAIMGPMMEMQIDQINQAPMLMVGSDLVTFLGTFGKRITVLDLGKQRPADADNAVGGSFSDRIAIVWDMNDTTALRQAMPMFQQQGAMFGGMAVEEQGAAGIRFNMSMMQPGLEGGVFVTNGQLLIALGAGVAEEALSALQAPPAAADTLIATPAFQRAITLLPPRSGFIWAMQDTDKMMTSGMDILHKEFEAMAGEDPEMAMIVPLMPTADEVKGVFGVGTSYGINTENGLKLIGEVELGLTE